jgi:hypothetical protein
MLNYCFRDFENKKMHYLEELRDFKDFNEKFHRFAVCCLYAVFVNHQTVGFFWYSIFFRFVGPLHFDFFLLY